MSGTIYRIVILVLSTLLNKKPKIVKILKTLFAEDFFEIRIIEHKIV